MTNVVRWTSADLEHLPKNGRRYEIIDGELYVTTQPHYGHQRACVQLTLGLGDWSLETNRGEVIYAPGLIFPDDDNVAPDLVWISFERRKTALGRDGKLHAAPELVVEFLSPGPENAYRDREVKLKLYSRRGVQEYWIVDWQARTVEVYRREQAALHLLETLYEQDYLQSSSLPGFRYQVGRMFAGFPTEER